MAYERSAMSVNFGGWFCDYPAEASVRNNVKYANQEYSGSLNTVAATIEARVTRTRNVTVTVERG